MNPQNFKPGRIIIPDEKDKNYLIASLIKKAPIRTSRYWLSDQWYGDQGNTSECVGYSWAHWIEDGPVIHDGIPPIIKPEVIYKEAQKIDDWPGENYDGTSVRAGAQYLLNSGKIQGYYWAWDINTLIDAVLTKGPVVVGTYWYSTMFYTDIRGYIKVGGYVVGGHSYMINGIDTVLRVFRIKNSWSKGWGKKGHAFISFDDMERLIKNNGEVCLAVENNF